jgi:antitoxin YefM
MIATNYSSVRQNLKKYCDKAVKDIETIVITRKNDENVVLLSESQYNNLMENLYIRSNPEYYNKLLQSIEQLKQGKVINKELLRDE